MQFRALAAAVLAFAAFGTVQAANGPIDPPVYPRVCGHTCGPVVTQSQGNCLNSGTFKCLCYQPDMDKLIPLCDACAYNARGTQNGKTFYPQIKQVMAACNFKSTTVTVGAAAATQMPLLGAGAAAAVVAYAAM